MAEIELDKPVILPVEGKPLHWKNVEYFVHKSNLPLPRHIRLGPISFDLPTNALHILHSNSGQLPPGSFMAILGSSGAGKTTFLNGLAQQYDDNGELRGSIHIGDQKLTKKKFSTFCGYVRQEDTLLPNCTVYETLMFYANMRLPSSMTRKERKQRVMMTMQKLGLVHCKDTLIGGKTRKGISGGEKRRVSIAVELIRNPTILFLDEPTSGLDSKTAMSVVENLVELAHRYNHSIVCTIHQPRSQIYNMFDYLMIMAKGKQIYYGRREEALPYFDGMGFYCPKHENPADYFIDLLTIDPTTKESTEASEERVQSLIKAASENPHIDESGGARKASDPSVGEVDGSAEDEESVDDALVNKNDQGGANFFWQVVLLTHRTIKNTLRDRQQLIGRLSQSVLLAILVIIIFYQIDYDQTSIQDRLSAVFMCLLGTAFSEAVAAGLVFPTERVVYQRERANRMYRISAYYIAKQISELPLQIITPLLFVCITYWAVGLRDSFASFVVFICIVLSMNFAVNSYGMLFGALLPAAICALVIPTILIVSLLAAGFYVNSENFPTWIAWIKYCSFFFYGFSAAIVNQFTDVEFYCRKDQFVEFSSTATCSSGVSIPVSTSSCPITDGQQIIDRNNADELEIWQYIIILLGIAAFFRVVLYFALRCVNPKEMELN